MPGQHLSGVSCRIAGEEGIVRADPKRTCRCQPKKANGKLISHEETTRWALKPEAVAKAESQARALFDEALKLYSARGSGMWLFGDDAGPSLLDAHLVPLISRAAGRGPRRPGPSSADVFREKDHRHPGIPDRNPR